jgi:hypothetical protein
MLRVMDGGANEQLLLEVEKGTINSGLCECSLIFVCDYFHQVFGTKTTELELFSRTSGLYLVFSPECKLTLAEAQ